MPWRAPQRRWVLLALLLAVAGGCRTADRPRAASRPVLRIGTLTDSPPMAFRQRRQWAGIEADLGRALADRLGMRPVFVALEPEALIPALMNGRVDILMAGLVITEDRQVQMDFSTPFLVVGQSALIRREELLRFNTPIKVRAAGGRVAVVEGSAGERWASDYMSRAEPVPFRHLEPAIQALQRGQVDVLIHDAPELWWVARQPDSPVMLAPVLLARREVAWGFRRGSARLRASANQALADWQQDGTLEAILRRWIPVSR